MGNEAPLTIEPRPRRAALDSILAAAVDSGIKLPDPLHPKKLRSAGWVVLSLVLLIGCGAWIVTGYGETVRSSGRVKIGDTVANVEAIMGAPHRRARVFGGTVAVYGSLAERFQVNLLYAMKRFSRRFGMWAPSHWGTWPVQIDYDDSGRVWRIYRAGVWVQR